MQRRSLDQKRGTVISCVSVCTNGGSLLFTPSFVSRHNKEVRTTLVCKVMKVPNSEFEEDVVKGMPKFVLVSVYHDYSLFVWHSGCKTMLWKLASKPHGKSRRKVELCTRPGQKTKVLFTLVKGMKLFYFICGDDVLDWVLTLEHIKDFAFEFWNLLMAMASVEGVMY